MSVTMVLRVAIIQEAKARAGEWLKVLGREAGSPARSSQLLDLDGMSAEEAKGDGSIAIGVVASEGDASRRSGMATGKLAGMLWP